VGASTIHSQLCMKMCYHKTSPQANTEYAASILRGVKLVILDEASMIGLNLIGFVDLRLRAIFQGDLPFGNVSVLLMGDFLQLPPVGDRPLFKKNHEAFGLEAAGIRAYESFQDCIFLDEIIRQGSDQVKFKEILGNVRLGKMIPDHERILVGRQVSSLTRKQLTPFMTAPFLFGDNARQIKYNT